MTEVRLQCRPETAILIIVTTFRSPQQNLCHFLLGRLYLNDTIVESEENRKIG